MSRGGGVEEGVIGGEAVKQLRGQEGRQLISMNAEVTKNTDKSNGERNTVSRVLKYLTTNT
jgi:fructose-1,6-bisphosphatase/sedoheptulose 1,7-bisphosphatase-like protein